MAERILSKSNPKIKLVNKLISSSHKRREQSLFVLEGLRLCCDALANGLEFAMLIYTDNAYEKFGSEIDELAKVSENVIVTDESVFGYVSDTVSPQGVLCVAKFDDSIRCRMNKNGKYIVLHNVANPDNLGAVARSAEAFGLDGMFVVGGCDVYNPKALRASMGALVRFPVSSISEDEFFSLCDEAGIMTFATTPNKSAKKLYECSFLSGCAVLIGNEANGLPQSVIERCTNSVTIPMNGRAESLNAAAAAAVMIYEMTRENS